VHCTCFLGAFSNPSLGAGMQLQPEMARQFAGLVQGLLLQTIEWLAGAMEAAGTNTPLPASGTTVSPASTAKSAADGASESDEVQHAPPVREGAKGVLLLACAARMFEQKNLREVLDGFVRALPSRDQLATLGVDLGEAAVMNVKHMTLCGAHVGMACVHHRGTSRPGVPDG
jgi:hypothetical protein